jgi:glycosyltransferase involved in cell wall biosynthesis
VNAALISDLLVHPLSGVGRYAYELATQLNSASDRVSLSFVSYRGMESWSRIEQRLSVQPQISSNKGWSAAHVRSLLVNTAFGSTAYTALSLAQYARIDAKQSLGVLHAPTLQSLPKNLRSKSVVTVHDLSHRVNASWHPVERCKRLDRALSELANADAVIAVSDATARELTERGLVPKTRVHVVHNGVASVVADVAAKSPPNKRRQTICVSTIEPRKNIVSLLLAYATLPKRVLEEHPLVLIGEYGWHSAALHAMIEKNQHQGWLRYLGHVPNRVLAEQYANSRLCVYPSLHEGFGLPVLEALATGTPVIAGNHSSIPEVAGDQAILLSSVTDIDELRESILAELDSPWDTQACLLRATHAAKFSWATTAKKTIDVYQTVLDT